MKPRDLHVIHRKYICGDWVGPGITTKLNVANTKSGVVKFLDEVIRQPSRDDTE